MINWRVADNYFPQQFGAEGILVQSNTISTVSRCSLSGYL